MSGRALYKVVLLIDLWSLRRSGFDKLFRADSASRRRSSRACWSVERDSFTRATASLSGRMLKLPMV